MKSIETMILPVTTNEHLNATLKKGQSKRGNKGFTQRELNG